MTEIIPFFIFLLTSLFNQKGVGQISGCPAGGRRAVQIFAVAVHDRGGAAVQTACIYGAEVQHYVPKIRLIGADAVKLTAVDAEHEDGAVLPLPNRGTWVNPAFHVSTVLR